MSVKLSAYRLVLCFAVSAGLCCAQQFRGSISGLIQDQNGGVIPTAPLVRQNIAISADQHLNVDLTLQIGASTQTVQVTSAPPLLENQNASQGLTINTREIEQIPLNGRTPLMCTQLAPGVALATNNLRADGYKNEDFSVIKNMKITERIPFQLRFEFLNLFNHPTYAAPNLNPTAASFGTITADATNQNMRQIQIGARLAW